MKKMFLMLAVLALASVVYAADVDISCNPDGDEVTVYYAGVNDANKPRGMAIRVDLDNGATITSVTPLENGYWVYPGSIDVEDPCQYNGTPVAEGGGVTDSYMIIEMGSLHSPTGYADGPTTTGQVIKFTVSGNCNVTTSGNAQRGGIVKYDATEADVNYTGCTVTLGCDCVGDINGDRWIRSTDINALVSFLSSLGSPYRCSSSQGCWNDCFDVNGDNWIRSTDINALVSLLSSFGSPYRKACPYP